MLIGTFWNSVIHMVCGVFFAIWSKFKFRIAQTFSNLIQYVLVHGPTFLGMWGGAKEYDICAMLSPSTSSTFWLNHMDECNHMIVSRAHSIGIGVYMGAVILLVWRFINFLERKWLLQHMLTVMNDVKDTKDVDKNKDTKMLDTIHGIKKQ